MAIDSVHLNFILSQSKEIEWLLRKQLQVVYDMALLSGEMSKVLHKNKKGQKLVERWYLLVKQLM